MNPIFVLNMGNQLIYASVIFSYKSFSYKLTKTKT